MPPAPGTVWLSAGFMDSVRIQASFSCVSACAAPPPNGMPKISAGIVSADFENTSVETPAFTALMAPPGTTCWGVPPARGTRYRLSVPSKGAVKKIVWPSRARVNALTDRSGVSNTVCFALVARS